MFEATGTGIEER